MAEEEHKVDALIERLRRVAYVGIKNGSYLAGIDLSLAGETAIALAELRDELKGSITKPYAECLGKQVDELEAENAKLRGALETIVGGVPRVRAKPYRADGVVSDYDKCPHDHFIYEGCEECVSDLARAALGEKS